VNNTEQRECKQEEALPSSWAGRLFFSNSEMAEDGRRSDCKKNRIGDFQLASAGKVFLLCSWRHTKHGIWIVRDYRLNKRSGRQAQNGSKGY
jgi:hypothetical protein